MRTLKSYARALGASFLCVQCAFRIQATIRKIPQPDALKRFKIYEFHDYLMKLRYNAKLQTRSPNENFQPVISPYLYLNPSLPFGMVRGCLDKREKKKKQKSLIHMLKSPRNFLSVPKFMKS